MLHEEVKKYRELSGDTNPYTPISRIGGYLDGYEKALEQEPCEDAISRQHFDERIRLAGGMVDEELSEEFKSGVLTVLEMLKTEPPVIPSRPTEPCDDAVSRDMALEKMADYVASGYADSAEDFEEYSRIICQLPSVNPQPKTGHCKDCKYFEYDSVAKVDGIPLIVAHEICKRWGDGCKTKEDGYCFLFEPQESEGAE